MPKITKAMDHIVVAMDTVPTPSLMIRRALAAGILTKYNDEIARVIEDLPLSLTDMQRRLILEAVRNHVPEED